MKELTVEQIDLVSGGLNPDPGYGAQANGFQPNVSAGDNGMGLLKDPLSNQVAAGLLGGAIVGPGTAALGAFAGALSGGAFNGIGSGPGGSMVDFCLNKGLSADCGGHI